MKAIGYVRVAQLDSGRPKLSMTSVPSVEPLKDSYGNALPTVAFAVRFDIESGAFGRAAQVVAELKVQDPAPAVGVTQIDGPPG